MSIAPSDLESDNPGSPEHTIEQPRLGRVTLIMATYGRLHCIRETVRQLTDAQTRSPHEVIIVNNDPSPGAEDAIRAILPDSDSRITVTTCTTGRQGAARNHGLSLATGEYVAFVDDDDDYSPDYIKSMAGALDLGIRSVRCQIQTCGTSGVDCSGKPTVAHHPCTPNVMARSDCLTATWQDPPNEDRDYWQRHPIEGAIDECLVFVCRGPGQHSPRNDQKGGSWRERFIIGALITDETASLWPRFVKALETQRYGNFLCFCFDYTNKGKLAEPLKRLASKDPRFLPVPRELGDNPECLLDPLSRLKEAIQRAAVTVMKDDIQICLRANERLAHSGVLLRLAHVYSEHPDVWATYGSTVTEPLVTNWPQASFAPEIWAQRGFRNTANIIGEFAPLSLRASFASDLIKSHAESLRPATGALPGDDDSDLPLFLTALESAGIGHTYPMAEQQIVKNIDLPAYRSSSAQSKRIDRQFLIKDRPSVPLRAHGHAIELTEPAVSQVSNLRTVESLTVKEAPSIAPVMWAGAFGDPSGYGHEARSFIKAIDQVGIHPILRRAVGGSEPFWASYDPATRDKFDSLLALPDPDACIGVWHLPPQFLDRIVQARYMVARTMFDTDGLSEEHVARCNLMDEIWVPSNFNIDTFTKAGVRAKLIRIPGGIDASRYGHQHTPFAIPGARKKIYLSTIVWSARKGWKTLLSAWANAFDAGDDVTLVFRSYLPGKSHLDCAPAIDREISTFLSSIGRRREELAPIIVLGQIMSDEEILQLYSAADVYVTPSSCEGWGYPYMEAMASGLPTIATNWGGHCDYMDSSNSLLCDVERFVPAVDPAMGPMPKQKWAKPSTRHLTELLRVAVDEPERALGIGAKAQSDIRDKWGWEQVAELVKARLEDISQKLDLVDRNQNWGFESTNKTVDENKFTSRDLPVVRWEGAFFTHSSLGLVNREIITELLKYDNVHIVARPTARHEYIPAPDSQHAQLYRQLSAPTTHTASVHIAHQWPPVLHPPAEGAWVLMQPWEYGGLPSQWIPVIRDQVDEYWVYCNWQRECAIASGVPENRIRVIPLGVDTMRYRPEGSKFQLQTRKAYKFLAIGGIIPRKGMDILIQAYLKTFSASDDVCLVIKGLSSRHAYNNNELQLEFANLSKSIVEEGGPAIEFVGDTLTDEEIASLYRACDVFVAPFRGEGFCLPIAEAMSSGLPVVVSQVGPVLDLCDEETAYMVPASQVSLGSSFAGHYSGHLGFWWAEPDVDALAQHMRHLVENPEAGRAMGQRARQRIKNHFTWQRTSRLISERIRELSEKPPLRFSAAHYTEENSSTDNSTFPLDDPRGTTVLYHPIWHLSDWKDPIEAYYQAFSDQDDVSLVLLLDPVQGISTEDVSVRLEEVRTTLNIDEKSAPDTLLVTDALTEELLTSLYRSVDWVLVTARDAAGRSRAEATHANIIPDLSLETLRSLSGMTATAK